MEPVQEELKHRMGRVNWDGTDHYNHPPLWDFGGQGRNSVRPLGPLESVRQRDKGRVQLHRGQGRGTQSIQNRFTESLT